MGRNWEEVWIRRGMVRGSGSGVGKDGRDDYMAMKIYGNLQRMRQRRWETPPGGDRDLG